MQHFKSVVLVDRENVAVRFIREWFHNGVGTAWLKLVGNPTLFHVPVVHVNEIKKGLLAEGRSAETQDVMQALLCELVHNENLNVELPALLIDPPTDRKHFSSMMMDCVLGSIGSTVISRYDREWFFNIAIGTGKAAWAGLYMAYNDLALSYLTMIKRLEVRITTLHPELTVFVLAREGDPEPNAPFGYTRFHSVGGILESHSYLAAICPTNHFMVIDGDCSITEVPKIPSKLDKTYLYRARNPYNGLVYGHGGIKIFRRQDVTSVNQLRRYDDFLLTVARACPNGLEVLDQVCSDHVFASSRKAGAITAYREAYKLAQIEVSAATLQEVDDARARISTWTLPEAYAQRHKYLAAAATLGVAHQLDHIPINDWQYLNKMFNEDGSVAVEYPQPLKI